MDAEAAWCSSPYLQSGGVGGSLLTRGPVVVVAALPRLPLLLPLLKESGEQDFEPVNRALLPGSSAPLTNDKIA